ncbi:Sec-independent protein translocase subunit TatA [Georgenia sp. 10Sc9-8]|uniref:Sec-independent protein translocase protein TatA n=1 Tax=Georgenia halotolerans TaxID=3028317 RepID=A0ABT5TZ77_9MICO|nr:Sec-independent protein translocase subunit TatA [Georgenia halotolerans]
MRPSAWAIVVLVIVVILLFGASKLPEVAGSIGKSLKVFKKEVRELREDDGTPSSSTGAGPQQPPQNQYQSPATPTASGTPPQQPPGQHGPPPGQPYPGQTGDGNPQQRT